jgi:DNA invertase Pin-like site-specific DNA recombinase
VWPTDIQRVDAELKARVRALLESRRAAVKALATVVVVKLDRFSRSVVDGGRLLEEARKGGFNIVALDLGLDRSTPMGELAANVLAAVAQWEDA